MFTRSFLPPTKTTFIDFYYIEYDFFRFGDDDEDNLITSGEGSSDGKIVPPFTGVHHPVYYRISFTVTEPYEAAFSDRNSFRYRDFSDDLIREIDSLYQSTPGTQSATVIKIE